MFKRRGKYGAAALALFDGGVEANPAPLYDLPAASQRLDSFLNFYSKNSGHLMAT